MYSPRFCGPPESDQGFIIYGPQLWFHSSKTFWFFSGFIMAWFLLWFFLQVFFTNIQVTNKLFSLNKYVTQNDISPKFLSS